MITIKNIEEMKKYYNEDTNAYIFKDNVEFVINVSVDSNITAYNINACDIKARDIKACDINAYDIDASDIKAGDINACEITAYDINAWDINAGDINAKNISYYAVCYAYNNITCETIKGRRENAKHFCLDGEITIKGESKYEK